MKTILFLWEKLWNLFFICANLNSNKNEGESIMTPTKTYYEQLAKTTIKNLEKRQMEAHY